MNPIRTSSPAIRPLEFDSSLFGYPVGALRVEAPQCTEQEARDLLEREGKAFRLLYLFSAAPLDGWGEPADIKLTFAKTPLPQPVREDIRRYEGGNDDRLLQLAFDSGVYSRFYLDPGFRNDEFRKLYRLWMERSLRGEIAEAVLVSGSDNRISGMVTVGVKGAEAEIGLIAVDASARGQGTGKQLLAAAEHYAAGRGCTRLTVATQAANTPAVGMYLRTGFTEISRLYIYHRWQQP